MNSYQNDKRKVWRNIYCTEAQLIICQTWGRQCYTQNVWLPVELRCLLMKWQQKAYTSSELILLLWQSVIKNAAKLIGQLFTAPTDNDQKHTVKEPNILSLQRNRNIVQWPPKSNHLISTPQSIFSAAEDKTEHRKTYKQEATEDCCSKCLTKSPKRWKMRWYMLVTDSSHWL